MHQPEFGADAGFHLANAGINHNVALAEEICAQEKQRIQAANGPELARLWHALDVLARERRELQALLGTVRVVAGRVPWPIGQCIMALIFVAAGFAFTRMSLEPFDIDPALLWISSVGVACLCAYGTSELLEKAGHRNIVMGLTVGLFVLSLSGLAILASVRGDLFLLHIENVAQAADAEPVPSTEHALAFYAAAAPKMRLFLTLLSLSLELAGGLALHAVRTALRARRAHASPERERLALVEREMGETEALIVFLCNEPTVFECTFRRNVYIGLLDGAARHAKANGGWAATVALLSLLAAGPTARGQAIDLRAGLDMSATSKASGYDGRVAHAENIEAAARIISTLPRGSRVAVSAISDQSFSRPYVLLSGEIPLSPGKLRELDVIAATRERLAAALRRTGTSIKPNFQSTDILGFLVAAGMSFRDAPHGRSVLVILSDMRQSAAPLDIEHIPVVAVPAAMRIVEQEHLLADLAGVDVFVYGVHGVGKDIRYWQSLRDFWTAYFARCRAHLRAFSMAREVPNFSETP